MCQCVDVCSLQSPDLCPIHSHSISTLMCHCVVMSVCPLTTTFFLSVSQSTMMYVCLYVPLQPPSSCQSVSPLGRLSVFPYNNLLPVSQSVSQSAMMSVSISPYSHLLPVSQSVYCGVCLSVCPLTSTSCLPQHAVDTAGHEVDPSEILFFILIGFLLEEKKLLLMPIKAN
jgi:hypothetical protein